jgi:hypothetical protein
VLDVAVKVAVVSLLILAVARPDLPQFAGKAMTGRAIVYPLAILVVPVAWWFTGRRRRVAYPYVLDILIGLPFLIDTAGNALNLYDTIGWWDDANHFVNWAILVAGFGQLLVRLPERRLDAWGLAVRLRGGHSDPLGARRILDVHPALVRAANRLHRHAGRSRARPGRFGAGGHADGDRALARL